jgi:HAD superfamily hydrolase (TIGR01509 family)
MTRPVGAAPFPAAVLWDMDGTLIDTEQFWIQAEYELVEAHGGTWSDTDAHQLVGRDLLDSAAYVKQVGGVPGEPVEIVNALMERVVQLMAGSPPWRPGALDLLHELAAAAIPSALVTMSWRMFADAVVELLPPGVFAAVIVGDEVERGKPHPEPYLAAARSLGVDAADCVAIEDSPTGAISASAAGCTVIGVPHVVEIPLAATDLIISSLTQLDVATLRRLVPA